MEWTQWWSRDHWRIQFPKRLNKHRWIMVFVICLQNWLESFLPPKAKPGLATTRTSSINLISLRRGEEMSYCCYKCIKERTVRHETFAEPTAREVTIQKLGFPVVEKHLKWQDDCRIFIDMVVRLLPEWWRETRTFPVTAQLEFKIIVIVDFVVVVVNFVRLVVWPGRVCT